MRVAIYHNLPSGGAKRALLEFIRNTGSDVKYDLYRIDDPINEEFLDVRSLVNNTYSYQVKQVEIPRFMKGLRMLEPILDLKRLINKQREIAKDIDKRGYDLVFVHHCRITQSPAILTFLDTPSIYYMQEPRRISFEYNFRPHFQKVKGPISLLRNMQQRYLETLKKKVDMSAERSAAMVLSNSYYSRESILRAYGTDSLVTYLGVNEDEFTIKENLGERAAISVGALHPAKGHDFIIRSLGTIPETLRPKLHIVYDRELTGYKEKLKSLASDMGVKIILHNNINQDELVRLYQISAVTTCAAQLEPFGFTPLESMACGTPVVAVKEGGYRETVMDHKNGLLVARVETDFGSAVRSIIDGQAHFESEELRSYIEHKWLWGISAAKLIDRFKDMAELKK